MYAQIAGVDFVANFALVVNDVTFRILLVLILMMRWYAEVIDIETVFLHGEMEEQTYMNLSEGLNLFEGKEENDDVDCVILVKYIYGTVQSAHQLAKKFKYTLKELKIEVSKLDPCLMTGIIKRGISILCYYVDDVLLTINIE